MMQRDVGGRDQAATRPGGWFLRIGLVVVAMLVAAVFAACGGSDNKSDTGSSDQPAAAADSELNKIFGPPGKEGGQEVELKTGMLLAMTGQGAYFGRVMSRGSKLAAAQIKASGGPTFDISIGDHESGEIAAGVSATRRLITQDKIKWLQTSYGAVSEAIIPIIQQNKILTFNGGGTSPGQVGKDFLWNNRMIFWDAPAPGQVAYLAKAYPDAKRLAIIGTEENGVPARKTIIPKMWPEASKGGSIVANEVVDAGTTDFASTIARIKAAKPDAIIGGLFGNDPGYFTKQLRQAGVDVPFLNTEFTTDACKVAGAAYDTFLFGHDFFDVNSKNPWTQIFVKEYKAKYKGETPDFYAANYYEQPFIMWELVRRVIKSGGDPTNTTDLQKAILENPSFPSVYAGGEGEVGKMTLDPKEHTVEKPMGIFKVKGCVPEQLATIKVIPTDADPMTALVSMENEK